jgi:ribosomal protein S18 acetylase RimI-like enzyme
MAPPIRRAAAFDVTYRPMAEEDLPFIAALFASTRAEEVAQTGWPEAMQRAFLAQQHQAQHHHYQAHFPDAEWLVVEAAGAPIGRLYLDERDDDLHLIDISLVPERRGAGIGTAILRDLLDQARALGKTITLYVEAPNPARRLYQRFGFNPEGEAGVYELMVWRP